ncbi:uncharacterized protein LOC119185773 [Rhipicephalus microplus]|uniref:uncharacterized protein LOC119185773 n=1 Tax=Rhipicephalus microplus TaxID=6941 RepID=UPI003F6CE69F
MAWVPSVNLRSFLHRMSSNAQPIGAASHQHSATYPSSVSDMIQASSSPMMQHVIPADPIPRTDLLTKTASFRGPDVVGRCGHTTRCPPGEGRNETVAEFGDPLAEQCVPVGDSRSCSCVADNSGVVQQNNRRSQQKG